MRQFARTTMRDTILWSAGLVAIGLAYLALPYDLIPDQNPHGLVDDFVILALCLAGALYVAPDAIRGRLVTDARFALRVLRADLGNFGLIEHRYVDGFVISGKNSGSHWVKYMLSIALAEQHGLEPPRFCSGREADRIVGRASRERIGRPYPQIATSHTIPSILLAALPLPKAIRQPPVVLLVRNIPDALVSGYRKWQHDYATTLADFARGDPSGKRYIADVWWYIHFFNRWGMLQARQPDRVLLVRYEDLLRQPELWLKQIARHLNLALSDAALARALALSTKDRMREAQDPDAGETIVPYSGAPPRFRATDREVIGETLSRFLRCDFGYGGVGEGKERLGEQSLSPQTPRLY